MYAFLAEQRRRLFPDEMSEDLFPTRRGRPSVPADVVATVMLLQSLEGLSDRDAIVSLRTDLRWKVAAGLALGDEGFHRTVLTLWRNKLRASERIFDAVRQVVTETGVLKGKTRRALDSTLLDDAVATQDTVTQLVSMIRRVRAAVPAAAQVDVTAHDCSAGGSRRVRGTTPQRVTSWSPGSCSMRTRRISSPCWRSSLAKTSSPTPTAVTGRSASPDGPRRTG